MYTAGQNDYGQLGKVCYEPVPISTKIGEKERVELTENKIYFKYYQDVALVKDENVVINFYPISGSPTQQARFIPSD